MRFLSNIWVSNESEILFNRRVRHADPSDFTANPAIPVYNGDFHLCFSVGFRCASRSGVDDSYVATADVKKNADEIWQATTRLADKRLSEGCIKILKKRILIGW